MSILLVMDGNINDLTLLIPCNHQLIGRAAASEFGAFVHNRKKHTRTAISIRSFALCFGISPPCWMSQPGSAVTMAPDSSSVAYLSRTSRLLLACCCIANSPTERGPNAGACEQLRVRQSSFQKLRNSVPADGHVQILSSPGSCGQSPVQTTHVGGLKCIANSCPDQAT